MPDRLTVQGIELVLDDTPKGPLISTANAVTEPLAWLVNLALDGRLPTLREALQKGNDVHYKGISAVANPTGAYELSGDFFSSKMTIGGDVILEVLATL